MTHWFKILFFILLLIPSANALNYTVYSNNDTYISSGADTTNYGTLNSMGVYNVTGNPRYESLISFDTSSYDTISSAKLYLYVDFILYAGTIEFFNITNRTWDELTVTYSTKPGFNNTNFTSKDIALSDENTWIEIDITDYANDNIGNELNFYIKGNETSEVYLTINTKEQAGTTYDPYVVIDDGVPLGTAIYGNVYEIINSTNSPLGSATVYLYNNSYSTFYITSTDGNYIFTGLENSSTYNIYAVKVEYDTTSVLPVTTLNGTAYEYNILMRRYFSPYIPNFVYEKFIVRDLFDRSYVGVTATVYVDDEATSSLSGTTDSTGAVVFQLIKDQRYRVTFTGGGISGTITIYVYAKEESYFVRVLTGFPTGGDRYTDISTNLTATTINATHSNLSLIYNDTISSTTALNFYATNLSTNVTCVTNSTENVVTLNCTVLASGTYQFGFNATSSTYGFFQEDKIINFDVGKPATPAVVTNVDSGLLQWASIILIVLTAALFSIKTVKYGAVIVPLEALALWAFGWFEPMANNQIGSFLLLSCAVVIGIMIYLRGSEVKVNF